MGAAGEGARSAARSSGGRRRHPSGHGRDPRATYSVSRAPSRAESVSFPDRRDRVAADATVSRSAPVPPRMSSWPPRPLMTSFPLRPQNHVTRRRSVGGDESTEEPRPPDHAEGRLMRVVASGAGGVPRPREARRPDRSSARGSPSWSRPSRRLAAPPFLSLSGAKSALQAARRGTVGRCHALFRPLARLDSRRAKQDHDSLPSIDPLDLIDRNGQATTPEEPRAHD